MVIDNISFHDAQILEVREAGEQTIDFILDFPTDWENNIFEKKILRFTGVITYAIDEIPFAGKPSILDVKNLGQVTKVFDNGHNSMETIRNKIEMNTNAGTRIIEFKDCEFID